MTREELVLNEQLKLRAAYLNGLAGSCFTVGVFTPVVTLLVYSNTSIEPDSGILVASILFTAICLSLWLHQRAGHCLEGLVS